MLFAHEPGTIMQKLQKPFGILHKRSLHYWTKRVYVIVLCVLCQDWEKTEAQKHREKLLLDELVAIVNKRDQLVQELDSQEKE